MCVIKKNMVRLVRVSGENREKPKLAIGILGFQLST